MRMACGTEISCQAPMRFLLDTNVLIPLEDSNLVLGESLAEFVRLATTNGHQLVYHPASESDIKRDPNIERQRQTLSRLKQYFRLPDAPACPWNSPGLRANDVSDNEILYALKCAAVHALVTEDRGIHDKSRTLGLIDRVYTIQTATDWLRRLHAKVYVALPNIEDRELSYLAPHLDDVFFDSLRAGYSNFDEWFLSKAREGKRAWVAWESREKVGGICIYAQQNNEAVTEEGLILRGPALKLCTFKVGEAVRGQKIGELFLKAAFRYATANSLEHIFIHGDEDQHHFLFQLLEDFGFLRVGSHPGSNGRDAVYVKRHPVSAPTDLLEPLEYLRRFFPHYRFDDVVGKYVVPIRPDYHKVLFPDYVSIADRQLALFPYDNYAGNAIKLAYLCYSQNRLLKPGDIVLFYRSIDEQALTSLGIVEQYTTLNDASLIAGLVKRRTVYSLREIEQMAQKPTRVMLFRLVRHLRRPFSKEWLQANGILKGPPQSITSLSTSSFQRLLHNEK